MEKMIATHTYTKVAKFSWELHLLRVDRRHDQRVFCASVVVLQTHLTSTADALAECNIGIANNFSIAFYTAACTAAVQQGGVSEQATRDTF